VKREAKRAGSGGRLWWEDYGKTDLDRVGEEQRTRIKDRGDWTLINKVWRENEEREEEKQTSNGCQVESKNMERTKRHTAHLALRSETWTVAAPCSDAAAGRTGSEWAGESLVRVATTLAPQCWQGEPLVPVSPQSAVAVGTIRAAGKKQLRIVKDTRRWLICMVKHCNVEENWPLSWLEGTTFCFSVT